MDLTKTAALLKTLRKEKGMTQKNVADALGLSAKTVSKWECAGGCPDVSVLAELSSLYGVDLRGLLAGDVGKNVVPGGNMKQIRFYVCRTCGNVITATGAASISCCGRLLEALCASDADEAHSLSMEKVEDELFFTSSHPMEKSHYLSFLAFVEGDRVLLIRQYPEWTMQQRMKLRRHGTLYWYCTEHGLFRKRI